MSKFTKREYRNIAKRPGQRGPGFPQRRKHPEEEWGIPAESTIPIKGKGMPKTRFESGKAQQEAVRPDAEAAAVTAEELFEIADELNTEEVLTDLGEQEREMELDNAEAAREVPPMSFSGSTIDKKGVK